MPYEFSQHTKVVNKSLIESNETNLLVRLCEEGDEMGQCKVSVGLESVGDDCELLLWKILLGPT
jgi:hypothetical protein